MAETTKEYYEIMYSPNYGGFSLPFEFLEAVFRAYPPDSDIGSKLWIPCPNGRERIIQDGETPDPSWDTYSVIVGEQTFYHGYKRLIIKNAYTSKNGTIQFMKNRKSNYITKDHTNYYYLSEYDSMWRDSPHVIELGKKFGLFMKKVKNSEDESSEEDSEDDDDEDDDEEDEDDDDEDDDEEDEDEDDESVLLDDDNEMEIVTSACKYNRNLALARIPNDYTYHIDSYDGNETVVIQFPYKKVILELLEARKTNSDEKLSPLTKKLIDGTLNASGI